MSNTTKVTIINAAVFFALGLAFSGADNFPLLAVAYTIGGLHGIAFFVAEQVAKRFDKDKRENVIE